MRRAGWRCDRLRRRYGCRRIGQDTLDDRRLLVGGLLRTAGDGCRIFDFVGHFVAGLDVVQTRVIVLEALKTVVGGLQGLIGNHQHVDALLQLNLGNLGPLFIEQERRHIDGYLAQNRSGVVFQGLFLDDAQNLQRRTFRIANMARTSAARAGNRGTFAQSGPQALATHLHQSKFADGSKLNACAVLAQGIAQAVFHVTAIAAFFHVDEVDHDQAT